MTTPTSASTNKTALRASLKKEDESLAERLVATDIPLVATPEPALPASAPASPPPPAAPVRKTTAKAVAKPVAAKPAPDVVPTPVAKAPAKTARKETPVKAATAKAAAPVAAPKAKPVSRKAAAKPAASPAKAAKPAKVAAKAGAAAVPPTAKEGTSKKGAKLETTVASIEKVAKEKGDRIVRYTVELLKSEEAAIEAVRAELAKAAGWAASKSDILRAGVRVFAEQRIEQMKELLGALATLSKGKKKS